MVLWQSLDMRLIVDAHLQTLIYFSVVCQFSETMGLPGFPAYEFLIEEQSRDYATLKKIIDYFQ